MDIAAIEKLQQQKWKDILAADLGGNEISDIPAVSDLTENNLAYRIKDDDSGTENMEIPEYRTDRFIIKMATLLKTASPILLCTMLSLSSSFLLFVFSSLFYLFLLIFILIFYF